MNKFLLLLGRLPLAGCVTTTPPTAVHQPMTARPEPRAAIAPSSGAIFSAASARPLFEDRRARFVGDTLIINIQEKVQASKKSENKTTRSADVDVSVPTIVGLPFKGASRAPRWRPATPTTSTARARTPRPTTSPARSR
jgi:flagellar L-ring protein precursor FlgH